MFDKDKDHKPDDCIYHELWWRRMREVERLQEILHAIADGKQVLVIDPSTRLEVK